MPVTAFCCRRHYRERDHNYEFLEELRRQRDNLSSSILIPYKVLITNYKILTIEKSSFNQASCNQLLQELYFQACTISCLIQLQSADWISTHVVQPISSDIYFYQTKGWTLKHHHLECFKVNSWKNFSYLEIKPLCICTSQKKLKNPNFQKICFPNQFSCKKSFC